MTSFLGLWSSSRVAIVTVLLSRNQFFQNGSGPDVGNSAYTIAPKCPAMPKSEIRLTTGIQHGLNVY